MPAAVSYIGRPLSLSLSLLYETDRCATEVQ